MLAYSCLNTSLSIPLSIQPSICLIFGTFRSTRRHQYTSHGSFSILVLFPDRMVFHWWVNHNSFAPRVTRVFLHCCAECLVFTHISNVLLLQGTGITPTPISQMRDQRLREAVLQRYAVRKGFEQCPLLSYCALSMLAHWSCVANLSEAARWAVLQMRGNELPGVHTDHNSSRVRSSILALYSSPCLLNERLNK